jgi:hypothetical protein
VGANLLAARVGAVGDELRRGQQHARRAEAALERIALVELVLKRRELAVFGKTFDRVDARACALHREHEAPADDFSVEPNRARAAHAVLAAHVRAGQAELIAQEIHEVQTRRDTPRDVAAIHGEGELAALEGFVAQG